MRLETLVEMQIEILDGRSSGLFSNEPFEKRSATTIEDFVLHSADHLESHLERWGAGVETQKNLQGEIGGWGRVPFNEPYAPSLSTIYDGA